MEGCEYKQILEHILWKICIRYRICIKPKNTFVSSIYKKRNNGKTLNKLITKCDNIKTTNNN